MSSDGEVSPAVALEEYHSETRRSMDGTLISVRVGDVRDAEEDYIAHQCNCTSRWGLGASKAIFARFPDADVYAGRVANDVPGHILVRGRIINMLA